MVSLVELYNVKESTLTELKSDRDPARGNKSKNREKDFYFVDEPADSETGKITSKVVRKPSFNNMVNDMEAEAQDMKELSETNPNDMVLYKLSEELKELYNKFRTHVRRNYND
tara:strand:+ start:124 stop:462 length:339 start_codon:yes stop_codon:yes gene_type:complete